MTKYNNKGVSFVEVLISVTIFAILLIPIMTKLITSMNINSKSKEKQYVVAYAEQAMEYFKGYDFDNVPMLKNADGDSIALTASNKIEDYVMVGSQQVDYYKYTYTTKVELGPKHREYDCNVTLSTLDYALRAVGYTSEIDNDGNITTTPIDASLVREDPNMTNLGNVKSLDSYVDAIITNTSNFDSVAEDSIYASKIDVLKSMAEADPTPGAPSYDNWLKYLNGTYRFDTNHTVNKIIRISIEKNTDDEYVVSCNVEYQDAITDYTVDPISYNVYNHKFKNKPDIYLMFNQCMYNGLYADDNIIIDNSKLNNEDVKVYVIGTYGTSGGGEVAQDTDGNDITGNKVYEILGEEAPNATKVGDDYVEADLVKKSKDGYYPYDKDSTGSNYRFKVYINTTYDSNQERLKVYVSDSLDDRYDLFARFNDQEIITNILASGSNIAMEAGVVNKMSEEKRLSETGSLFTIHVSLSSNDSQGSRVTLNGTKGGN